MTRDALAQALRARFGVGPGRASDEGFSEEVIQEILTCVLAALPPETPANSTADYWRCGCGQLNNPARKVCGNCESSVDDKTDPIFGRKPETPVPASSPSEGPTS